MNNSGYYEFFYYRLPCSFLAIGEGWTGMYSKWFNQGLRTNILFNKGLARAPSRTPLGGGEEFTLHYTNALWKLFIVFYVSFQTDFEHKFKVMLHLLHCKLSKTWPSRYFLDIILSRTCPSRHLFCGHNTVQKLSTYLQTCEYRLVRTCPIRISVGYNPAVSNSLLWTLTFQK